MLFEMLLAKSCDEISKGEPVPAYARLVPHLRAVERVGEVIVEVIGPLILEQLDLPSEPWLSRLQRGLKVACLCHDIGKANVAFQRMVRGKLPPTQQPARHELLSALLLADRNSQVRTWALNLLSENGKHSDAAELLDLLNCVIAAVGGHHVKLDDDWKRASIALRDGGCGTELKMLLTHPDLRRLFGSAVQETCSFDLTGNKEGSLEGLRLPFKLNSNRWKDKLQIDPGWWRFAATLKALTTAADVAGSALLPERISPAKWVQVNLDASQRVTAEQMHEVVRARLQGKTPRPFQQAVCDSKKRVTLVEAGCGTGKTAAAYMWAATHAHGRKLFFCYPTTGTATEGYLGYVHETDVEATLMHSRAIVDLENVTKVKQDEEEGDHLLRIESLRAWSPQVVICTADTVLALVRNNRRGLYNSPAILAASFVFDELHAYDDRMFAGIIALIKALPRAHFLLMTASLPKARKEFLLQHIEDVEQVATPRELEELPRYLFQQLASKEDAYAKVKDAAHNNLKILWICNTVGRAQSVFQRLQDEGLPVKAYHSRFKYEDRKVRHREVIDGFAQEKSPCGMIAVTTQVAEMSLDLDADILISEVAPIPALIQRLGRLNRRITPDNPGIPRTAYFLMPEGLAPYHEKKEDFEQGQRWIEELIHLNRPLSQADLAALLNTMASDAKPRLDLHTNWLDSGWFAEPESVREPSVTVSVILHQDEKDCRQDVQLLIKKAIPMNLDSRRPMKTWEEFKGNLIAPPDTIDYDKEGGARWL